MDDAHVLEAKRRESTTLTFLRGENGEMTASASHRLTSLIINPLALRRSETDIFVLPRLLIFFKKEQFPLILT